MVFGFHDGELPCPEVIREADGTYVACAHESHKVDSDGNRIKEKDRKAALLSSVVPEVERRFNAQENTVPTEPTSSRPARSKQPQPCLCECGGTTKGGRFLPGHDARLKGRLLKDVRDENASKADRAAAVSKMDEFGWGDFLSRDERAIDGSDSGNE